MIYVWCSKLRVLSFTLGASVLFLGVSTARAQTVANAATFGWTAEDATAALQAAIDTKRNIVLVPNMGSPWIIGETIMLQSNQTLIFEPGVVVEAKRGAFHGTMDSLFFMDRKNNISIVGYGATFQMWKEDYADPSQYTFAEWRHGIQTKDVSNVTIEGLTIRNTGGDGIYLGTTKSDNGVVNTNVTIKNVTVDNNYRQGISVISVNGLLIDNVNFVNTSGTAPKAGIDFEPNDSFNVIQNVTIRNSVFQANDGIGVKLQLHNMADPSGTSGVVENNTIIGNGRNGIKTTAYLPDWEFRDNLVIGNGDRGMIQVHDGRGVVWTQQSSVSHTAFWGNQNGATQNITEGAGVVKNAEPVFISTDPSHPYYMYLSKHANPNVILSGAADGGYLGARGAVGAPTMPASPVSGFLFDENYANAGDIVTDRFGSRHGKTNVATAGTAVTPLTSSDTPFGLAGNRSIETAANASNRTGYVTWDGTTFSQALDGAEAVTVQAWVKYDTLRSGTNSVLGLLVNGGSGGIFLTIDGFGSVSIGGRSLPTDDFQSGASQMNRLVAQEWNQIVGVLDFANDLIRISINGAPFESFDVAFGSEFLVSGTGTTTPDQLFSRASTPFVGLVDEIALWKTALTQEEVLWLNQNSLSLLTVPEPRAIWLAGLGVGITLTSRIRRRMRTCDSP